MPGTLDISGSITRSFLTLSDLDLNTDTYKIIRNSWGPGSITHQRQKVSSPYIPGDFLTNVVKEQVEMPLGIRVTGTGYVDCMNKMGVLLRAFEQFYFILTIEIEGTTFEYVCEAADYTTGDGGAFQDFHFRAYKQEVQFSIPRRPNPTQGPA